MTIEQVILLAAVVFGIGVWLALPRGEAEKPAVGIFVALAGVVIAFAVGIWAGQLPVIGGWLANWMFTLLAAVTVLSGICAMTFRNPVYCALWFAMALLGTAGLMLLQGAQFLGLATVVVYAGAIVVTFLFVLMLAQPEGHASYDRLSWDAKLSAGAGAAMVGILTMAITGTFGENSIATKLPEELASGVLARDHVANLGGQLFSQQLVAVEVAGVLLTAALIGATVIVSSRRRTASGSSQQPASSAGVAE